MINGVLVTLLEYSEPDRYSKQKRSWQSLYGFEFQQEKLRLSFLFWTLRGCGLLSASYHERLFQEPQGHNNYSKGELCLFGSFLVIVTLFVTIFVLDFWVFATLNRYFYTLM